MRGWGICCECFLFSRSGPGGEANAHFGYSMLAVMTMNVGYFLSVLAGIFVGELAIGRYAHADEH